MNILQINIGCDLNPENEPRNGSRIKCIIIYIMRLLGNRKPIISYKRSIKGYSMRRKRLDKDSKTQLNNSIGHKHLRLIARKEADNTIKIMDATARNTIIIDC